MDLSEFSLLYPPMYDESTPLPDITEETVEQLELDLLFDLKNCSLSDFFTVAPEVIRYRQDVFDDMAEFPEIAETLSRVVPVLLDIGELRRLAAGTAVGTAETQSYLFSITEIELYTLCISILHDGFAPLADKVKSEAFKTLATRINELTESEYYRDLNEKLSALTQRVRDIKSITVGVNLDSQLRPVYAGVLSINSRPFKSGEVIDKILRLDFRRDDMTCIAPLTPFMKGQSENQQYATAHAFYSAINDVFRSSIHSWRRVIQMYVLENTDFLLRILPEIEFVVKASRVNAALKKRGVKLCRPEIRPASERVLQFYNLYNPVVALRIDDDIVKNDLIFDDDAMIYVLTGPNRGGKSVITCALGQAVAFAMLGMPVPADSAVISPADGIYTHFPTGSEDTIDKGRLGEECARLKEIFDRVTPNSLVLLDETLSSTGAYEASYIAAEVLTGFAVLGCRCLFSTHLHELASKVDEINKNSAREGGVKVDNLVAGISDGQRNFKIRRAMPDGRSYARDIASQYGLSYDQITEKIKHKRGNLS
ncbi:MAG: hypothetical protein WBI55_08475 [Eubacteriales bacterium]|jgi:DNA mismatch repair protein MutS|nr:hypothetical protein [Clostridiales bacterium]